MTADDRSLRAAEIFERALDLPPGGRANFVAEACGGDDALKRNVLELIEIDVQIDREGFPLLGRQLGDFTLLRGLGRGGMGIVYEADQRHPRRRVALKLLPSISATDVVVRRFRNEVDLLARLHHPNIATAYAAGTFEVDGASVPFLAMELVREARDILEFADRRRLRIDARVGLLTTVCDAVEHGHRKGVIHRDLKPENVLVDPGGRPKLIDFGVAKIVDTSTLMQTIRTSPGQLIGTLQYMCPEQCSRDTDLDTRGDVYSLGVILFELVAGRPRLDFGDSIQTAIQTICTTPPPRPSQRNPRVSSALDTIIVKATATRREDRYTSVAALAADLRRYLAREPIVAQPPSRWIRLTRWVGRHPLLGTAVACSGLVAAVAAWTWFHISGYLLAPDRLQITSRGTVELRSRADIPLHSWPAPNTPLPESGLKWLNGPDELPLAMIIYKEQPVSPNAGHAFFYPIAPPSRNPVWSTAVELEDFKPAIEEDPESHVGTRLLRIDDVLPAVPGLEIVFTQRLHPHDFSALRVFDARGAVRFAVYHRGTLLSARLVPSTSRLVVAAYHSRNPWPELEVESQNHPAVVFAVEVTDGYRGRIGSPVGPEQRTAGFLVGTRIIDPAVRWYRWLGPVDVLRGLSVTPQVLRATGRYSEKNIQIEVRGGFARSQEVPAVALIVDPDGNVVDRFVYDSFAALAAADAPPLPDVRLMPLAEMPVPR